MAGGSQATSADPPQKGSARWSILGRALERLRPHRRSALQPEMADILAASAQPDPKQKAATEPVAGLPADLVERMRVDTLAWQAVGGLLIGADASITPAPCSLLPYPWPAELFAQAQALAVPFNSMVDRIARDTDWLHNATRSVGATDQFTSRLLALSEAVHATGASQAWQLGIFRSDYMIHQRTPADAPLLVQVRRHNTPTPASEATHARPFPNNPQPFRLQIQRMATYSRPPPSPPTLSSDPSSSPPPFHSRSSSTQSRLHLAPSPASCPTCTPTCSLAGPLHPCAPPTPTNCAAGLQPSPAPSTAPVTSCRATGARRASLGHWRQRMRSTWSRPVGEGAHKGGER